jgi:hypothetical protein
MKRLSDTARSIYVIAVNGTKNWFVVSPLRMVNQHWLHKAELITEDTKYTPMYITLEKVVDIISYP